MENKEFIIKNLELAEKQLRYSLRIVSNLQTLIMAGDTIKVDHHLKDTEVIVERSEKAFIDSGDDYCKLVASKLVKDYFHPSIVKNGKGVIDYSNKTQQYQGRLTELPVKYIVDYPVGFYNDDTDKGLQFLFKVQKYIVVIDSVDNSPVFYFCDTDRENLELVKFDQLMFNELTDKISSALLALY